MTDYPSDAPLPQWKITRVQGYPTPDAVTLRFSGELTNYQTFKDWLESKGYAVSDINFWPDHKNGSPVGLFQVKSDGTLYDGPEFWQYIERTHFGKWAPSILIIAGEIMGSFHWSYDPLGGTMEGVSLGYSVYVPSPDELTPDVWSDLQFKQTQAPSGSGFAVIVPLILILLLFLFVGLSGGKKHRHH